jgi:hypothetical protein
LRREGRGEERACGGGVDEETALLADKLVLVCMRTSW